MLQAHMQIDNIDAKYAIMPGDPKRIDVIKSLMENCVELNFNREYRSVIGTYKGVKVIAVSTGMGGSSTSIAVEELHNLGVHTMIRVGSAGALQKGIGLADMIIGEGAIRNDGASKTYVDVAYPACPDHHVVSKMIEACKENNIPYHCGVIQSHETFYHDSNPQEEEYWSKLGVLGSDFESAALFTVARVRGCRAASILNNVVIYGQDSGEAVASYGEGEDITALGEKRECLVALEAFYKLENE